MSNEPASDAAHWNAAGWRTTDDPAYLTYERIEIVCKAEHVHVLTQGHQEDRNPQHWGWQSIGGPEDCKDPSIVKWRPWNADDEGVESMRLNDMVNTDEEEELEFTEPSAEGVEAARTAFDEAGTVATVPVPAPARRRDLIPAPGQVIVLRNDILPYLTNPDGSTIHGINGQPMQKPQRTIDDEERANVHAVVGRVGDDDIAGNRTAWFKTGDEVVIAPHVFTEVVIAGGPDGTVWLGPFAGIKAKFIDADADTGAELAES